MGCYKISQAIIIQICPTWTMKWSEMVVAQRTWQPLKAPDEFDLQHVEGKLISPQFFHIYLLMTRKVKVTDVFPFLEETLWCNVYRNYQYSLWQHWWEVQSPCNNRYSIFPTTASFIHSCCLLFWLFKIKCLENKSWARCWFKKNSEKMD